MRKKRAARVRPHGRISIGGFFMLVGIIAGGYWLVLFGPLYIDHFEVIDAVSTAFNAYGIESDHAIRAGLVGKLREAKFTTHKELNNMGEEVDVPGFAVTDTNPYIHGDEVQRILTVRYEYDRVVHLIPTQKVRVVHFVAQKKGKFPH